MTICAMVKSPYIGDGHPTFNRNPYNGYINPYYWVDDRPLLYGNNGSLDPGTYKYHTPHPPLEFKIHWKMNMEWTKKRRFGRWFSFWIWVIFRFHVNIQGSRYQKRCLFLTCISFQILWLTMQNIRGVSFLHIHIRMSIQTHPIFCIYTSCLKVTFWFPIGKSPFSTGKYIDSFMVVHFPASHSLVFGEINELRLQHKIKQPNHPVLTSYSPTGMKHITRRSINIIMLHFIDGILSWNGCFQK